MNISSSFIEEQIWPFWTVSWSNLLTYHWPLQQEIWLAVYSRSNLIGVTYIHLSLTDSLTHWLIHWPVHNILDAPTKRYFFYKKITQKWLLKTWLQDLWNSTKILSDHSFWKTIPYPSTKGGCLQQWAYVQEWSQER